MGYKEIGRKIQKAREEAGLNQEELAARIGLSQATLSNYELGKRRLYLAQLEAISRELGKPLQYFLEENDRLPDHSAQAGHDDPELKEIVELAKNLTSGEKKQVVNYLKFLLWQKREGK